MITKMRRAVGRPRVYLPLAVIALVVLAEVARRVVGQIWMYVPLDAADYVVAWVALAGLITSQLFYVPKRKRGRSAMRRLIRQWRAS